MTYSALNSPLFTECWQKFFSSTFFIFVISSSLECSYIICILNACRAELNPHA